MLGLIRSTGVIPTPVGSQLQALSGNFQCSNAVNFHQLLTWHQIVSSVGGNPEVMPVIHSPNFLCGMHLLPLTLAHNFSFLIGKIPYPVPPFIMF